MSRWTFVVALACVCASPAVAQRIETSRAAAVTATRDDGSGPVQDGPIPGARRKNGFVAFGLAYLAPGLGHFYVGETWRGATVLGTVVGGLMLSFSAWESDASLAASSFVAAYVVYLWSMVDAPLAARRHNREMDRARQAQP